MVMSDGPYATPYDIRGVCDECGEPTTSECMCGEVFCSRKCLAKAWGDHRSLCETVIHYALYIAVHVQSPQPRFGVI